MIGLGEAHATMQDRSTGFPCRTVGTGLHVGSGIAELDIVGLVVQSSGKDVANRLTAHDDGGRSSRHGNSCRDGDDSLIMSATHRRACIVIFAGVVVSTLALAGPAFAPPGVIHHGRTGLDREDHIHRRARLQWLTHDETGHQSPPTRGRRSVWA